MKKKTLLISIIIAALAIITNGTVAYFTAEETAHNIITTGGIDIDLLEKTKLPDGTLEDFPEDGIGGVMPGTAVSKIVYIKNVGLSEAWVRIKIESTIVDVDGNELPATLEDGSKVMSFEVSEKWVEREGYYYYTERLSPDDVTENLMEKVTFNPDMGNEYQLCTANLIITAEAVQTANNGDTVFKALGWEIISEEE